MKTPLSILLTSGVCAAQLAFSASLVPNGGFEEGADAPATWGAPNPAKGIDFPVEGGNRYLNVKTRGLSLSVR